MSLKPEYSLQKHQDSAVETALKRDGNLLLSHPVGSGKTLSSIGARGALGWMLGGGDVGHYRDKFHDKDQKDIDKIEGWD